eukprot:m.760306 g.760306  ORF g.760306 m.760306 type:complete len:310 (-) comp23200_c0_seq5:1278-2207(-)
MRGETRGAFEGVLCHGCADVRCEHGDLLTRPIVCLRVQAYPNLPNSMTGRAKLTAGTTYTLFLTYDGIKSQPSVTVQPAGYNRTTLRSMYTGQIDYYFVFSLTVDGAIKGYRSITGAAPPYARYAYGFWQCKEHYHNKTELLSAAARFRAEYIPIDAIVQDWHYWGNEGWGPQWDPSIYPDPAGMVSTLHAADIHLMVSVWSKFDKQTSFYKVLDANGQLINGSIYYDPYNDAAREQYYQFSKKAMFDIGVGCNSCPSCVAPAFTCLTRWLWSPCIQEMHFLCWQCGRVVGCSHGRQCDGVIVVPCTTV